MLLSNEDFKYKIVNASPTRLVIVTYELILDRIKRAENSLNSNNMEDYRYNINNAMQFTTELICSLNMKEPISLDMSDLYFFVNKLLVSAMYKKEVKHLNAAKDIIVRLKEGLAKEVDDGFLSEEKSALASDNYINKR